MKKLHLWQDETKPVPVRFRDALQRDRSLEIVTKGILYTLAQHYPEIFPSVQTIADEAGCSKRTALRHLETARKTGWIKRVKHGSYLHNSDQYELIIRPPGYKYTGDSVAPVGESLTPVGDFNSGTGATVTPARCHRVTTTSKGTSKEQEKEENLPAVNGRTGFPSEINEGEILERTVNYVLGAIWKGPGDPPQFSAQDLPGAGKDFLGMVDKLRTVSTGSTDKHSGKIIEILSGIFENNPALDESLLEDPVKILVTFLSRATFEDLTEWQYKGAWNMDYIPGWACDRCGKYYADSVIPARSERNGEEFCSHCDYACLAGWR